MENDLTPIPDIKEAKRQLRSYDCQGDEFEAASLACWMILEKNISLDHARRTAKRKYGVAMSTTERWVRQVIPQHFFDDRAYYGARQKGKGAVQGKGNASGKARDEFRKQVRRHMDDL